ncbi:MAG: class I SAM-dependent methyltransferase [Deferribacteres bacterium]|nr:class I SAM-dependent methyltransferase [candidate division KSB1 bacterium]MCB9512649.1 class I SAM-dependent methyltransferase [Deferribacteres bacterium]
MDKPAVIDEVIRASTPRKLNVSEFPSRRHYYWAYQYMLANLYLCPQLERWGFDFKGKSVLDVGCGTGGIACTMMDRGARVDGVDIFDLEKPYLEDKPFRFIIGDMCDPALLQQLDRVYDFAILRDVIEHIADKKSMLQNIADALKSGGKLFITFPPYYSPFGGHTQILQSSLGLIPYTHLLPKSVFQRFVNRIDAHDYSKEEVLRLKEIRTTISEVESVIAQLPFRILQRKYYAIRPTFHIRYGVKPLPALWGRIPLLREVAVMAAFYYLEKR